MDASGQTLGKKLSLECDHILLREVIEFAAGEAIFCDRLIKISETIAMKAQIVF